MMYRFFILCLLCAGYLSADAAVTYDFSGGRFGDNVLTYLHAKWLSYHYKMPLLYKPFHYSSELVLDEREILYSGVKGSYRQKVSLSEKIPQPFASDFIFTALYFPEIEWELKKEKYFTFPIDWKDPEFRKIANEMIASKTKRELTSPPQNVLSIAIHMREGGGFDDEEHKIKHPLKTPPVTFYIDSLKKVLALVPGKPLYCHVFTDAVDPKAWIDKIQQALPGDAPITFHYRKDDNRHDSNVLEDFYSLFNFDILIRAESNYSIVPSLIHDYAVVCYPKTYLIQGRTVTIEQIQVDIDNTYLKQCQERVAKLQKGASNENVSF